MVGQDLGGIVGVQMADPKVWLGIHLGWAVAQHLGEAIADKGAGIVGRGLGAVDHRWAGLHQKFPAGGVLVVLLGQGIDLPLGLAAPLG